MEKINGKGLQNVNSRGLKSLIITSICILFLFYSDASVLASSISYNDTDALQQSIISGTVTDGFTGEALIGVSVVVKGTMTGTLTDIDGKFS